MRHGGPRSEFTEDPRGVCLMLAWITKVRKNGGHFAPLVSASTCRPDRRQEKLEMAVPSASVKVSIDVNSRDCPLWPRTNALADRAGRDVLRDYRFAAETASRARVASKVGLPGVSKACIP